MSGPTPATPARARARVLLPVRWSDVDLFGHVNNAAFLRFLDDARFAAFPVMGVDAAGRITDTILVVVKHEMDFLAPVPFTSEPLAVEVWVSRIGGSSVDFGYEVQTADGATTYLLARSRMVQVDRANGRPRPLDEVERTAFAAHTDEAPTLRGW